VSTGAPIVMVVFDEFADTALLNAKHQIDRERNPNFAALADDSTWYRNASSVADMTPRAVPGIVSVMLMSPSVRPVISFTSFENCALPKR